MLFIFNKISDLFYLQRILFIVIVVLFCELAYYRKFFAEVQLNNQHNQIIESLPKPTNSMRNT